MILGICIVTAFAWIIGKSKVADAYDAKRKAYSDQLAMLRAIFLADKGCLHYHSCTRPGLKNIRKKFTIRERHEISAAAQRLREKRDEQRREKLRQRTARREKRFVEKGSGKRSSNPKKAEQ